MNVKSTLGTILIVFSLVASLLLMPRAYAAPQLAATSSRTMLPLASNSRTEFQAVGRTWKFIQDGVDGAGVVVLVSSVDGTTWSGKTTIFASTYLDGFSFKWDGTNAHYVRNVEGDALYYRGFTPQADGSIVYLAAEQTIPGTFTNVFSVPSVDIDTAGHVIIGYSDYDGAHYHPYVTMSGNTDGTWGATPGGFPYELSATSSAGWCVMVEALTAGKFMALYSKPSSVIRAQCYNGTWSYPSATTNAIYAGSTLSAVAIGDAVEVVYLKAFGGGTYDILSTTWFYDASRHQYFDGANWVTDAFTPDRVVQADVTGTSNPVLGRDPATGDLFCIWIGAPTANHFYYKRMIPYQSVSSVDMRIWRNGTVGTLLLTIQETNGTKPTGVILGSTSMNLAALSTNTTGTWTNIPFSTPVILPAYSRYALVGEAPGLTGTVNWITEMQFNNQPFPFGDYLDSQNSGATWTRYLTFDTLFSINDGATVVESLTVAVTPNYWIIGNDDFMAQSFYALGKWDAAPTDIATDADITSNIGISCSEQGVAGVLGVSWWDHALAPRDVMYMLLTLAPPETYNISVSSLYPEVEAGFSTLLYADCVDHMGLNHNANITFTVGGAAFAWNTHMNRYECVVTQNSPTIRTYGVLTVFADSEDPLSTATVIQNATVTWTNSRLNVVVTHSRVGDLPGMTFDMGAFTVGATFLYTFIATGLSLAIYQHSGPEATFIAWMLMWGGWSAVVDGTAVLIGLAFLSLGGGLILTKIYLDRRNS